MPYHESTSPARRPQLVDRNSSTQSMSRGSPNSSHPVKPHPSKKHMSHAIGHHRHSHGRIPSYSKNLSKLAKSNIPNPTDGQRHHVRTKSQTPTSSPVSQHIKRNSSNFSLVSTAAKASVKAVSSNHSLKHNESGAKLGHVVKPQLKPPHSRNESSSELPLRGRAKFSVGQDDQDEEWVEASSSQSPNTPKQTQESSKTPRLEEPPSPDEPPGQSAPILPQSPPQSPPIGESQFPNPRPSPPRDAPSAPYSRPPDAGIVTHRLLNRHRPHNVAPQMSSISATVTPSGSNGSPAFNHSQDSTVANDLSMPADGISRFLHPTGSSPGSATPGSVSLLQNALANIHRSHQHDRNEPSPSRNAIGSSHRTKSNENVRIIPFPHGEDESSLPPSPQVPTPNYTRASPFKSAHEPREAAKSLTQLKLDLQRMSTNRESAHTPATQSHLTKMHGVHTAASMVGVMGERSSERRARQWDQAALEYRNGKRFNNMLVGAVTRLEKKREKKKVSRMTDRDEDNNKIKLAEGKAGGRGRVRFEVGSRETECEEEEEDEGGGSRGGVPELLKRMWETNISLGG